MLAKIDAFLNPPAQTFRTYRESDTSLPARYARAIAWYRQGETQRAVDAVDVLIAEDPENPYYWELKGQILFEAGSPADAVPAHARAVELMPQDAPLLRINLAHALIETHDETVLERAITELRRATIDEPNNPMAWRLMSQAYATLGLEGEARLASAEFHFSVGQQRQATQFALRAATCSIPDRSSGGGRWTSCWPPAPRPRTWKTWIVARANGRGPFMKT